MEMQAKLLRALQEKEIRPVGSNEKIGVDSRVIAATNRDLEEAYQAGTFRKDLYFRLNVVTIHLPSLRERRSDIPLLVHCFLERYAPEENVEVTQAAMKCLLQYEWPGNVRELENCIARALTLGGRKTIDVSDLPPVIARMAAADELGAAHAALTSTALADLERATIERVYEQARGDKSLAAQDAGDQPRDDLSQIETFRDRAKGIRSRERVQNNLQLTKRPGHPRLPRLRYFCISVRRGAARSRPHLAN